MGRKVNRCEKIITNKSEKIINLEDEHISEKSGELNSI